jgi:hypothetical protein
MSRLVRLLPPLLFAALVVLALWPTWRHGAQLSSRYDWRYFESMAEVARRTVAWYQQAPLWNPYSCGGEVDLANPQSLDGAPTFLLTLLFGTAWGFKLALGAYYFLALGGMYKLARRLELSLCPSLLSAVAFGLSGYLAMHLSAGHINFASVALFPLLIYFFDRSFEQARWIIAAGAIAAWIAVYGGTFTPALAGELLLLWVPVVAARLPQEQDEGRAGVRFLGKAAVLLAVCAVVAFFVAAYRMLPALEFIVDHPRPLFRRTPDTTLLHRLLWDLFAWRDLGPLPGRKYWSHEYTARLPQVVAPLVVCALIAAVRPRFRRLVVALVGLAMFSALLCLGNFAPVAPWSLLQKLPVLRDLRVPSRHLILLVFFAALLGGIGAQAIRDWLAKRPRLGNALGVLLVALAAVDATAYTAFQFRDVFSVNLPMPPSPPRFYHVQGHWSQMRELIFAGHGVSGCDEEAPLQRAKQLDLGDVPQAKLADETAGAVIEHLFSPNRRRITVELSRSNTLLLINSNWNEHFRLDAPSQARGARIERPDGKLAIDLTPLGPGRHTLEVIYAPRSFTIGLALSLIAWPLLLLLFWFGPRRRSEA